MQNRREFLVKSVGATAAVAAIGMLDTACAPPPEPVATGYGVGQRLLPVLGRDQYGGTSGSADYDGSWVLVDICPWWCNPCRSSAVHHADFVRSATAAGVDLRILAIVVEDLSSAPSVRSDAERWSGRFGLDSEIVLHCDGDPGSPLRQLSSDVGSANGVAGGAFPTYVLVDPNGIVRHYQASSDLNQLQAAIVQHTGAGLSGTWAVGDIVLPSVPEVTVATVTAGGMLLGGIPLGDTMAYGDDGPNLHVGDSALSHIAPSLAAYGAGAFTLAAPLDPEVATSFTVSAASPSPGRRYTRVIGLGPEIAVVPDDALSPTAIDETKIVHTQGVVTSDAEATTLTVPPAASTLGAGRTSSMVLFRRSIGALHWSMPYSLAEQLAGEAPALVADPGAAGALIGDLQLVRNALSSRQFAEAATAANIAASRALDAGAAFPFVDDVRLLVELLEAAAAGL
ncbi:redoxin domain-containing protein [Dermatobacter hominis]|uniref:redoxin domain-containing protein n=1 Tax=Dermatobacter hominis TaxID=2884263 RepID=UPI001D111E1D|nr:redoxin domain-containing protein [Dermatobacter hominis]UDY35654.1 redoxin domain-containing protein [Dermatobacter hominis]